MVFRMWGQYQKYHNAMQVAPRQLFVTKNTVLRNEVERSFRNLSMAYNKTGSDIVWDTSDSQKDGDFKFPVFMASAEWLETLDDLLPGRSFFSKAEADNRRRLRSKDGDDVVRRGMEELNDLDDDCNINKRERRASIRREMDFTEFRQIWNKINSKVNTKLNESLVWLEVSLTRTQLV